MKGKISRRLGFSRITVHRILNEYTKAQKEQEGDKSKVEAYILTPPIYKTENRPKRRLTEDIIRIVVRYKQNSQEISKEAVSVLLTFFHILIYNYRRYTPSMV
ncbi:MAG: hypothetical protein PHO36_09490 [Parabacteroides sp.]|nr:hypothetical protein [Parabacteroides sp.]